MTAPVLRRQRGFSLLELLVALAIMGISLASLYQATGGSIHAAGLIDRQAKAMLLAESLLAQQDTVLPGGWHDHGQWQDYTWSVSSTPLLPGGAQQVALHRVEMQVGWRDGGRLREIRVATLLPELAERQRP